MIGVQRATRRAVTMEEGERREVRRRKMKAKRKQRLERRRWRKLRVRGRSGSCLTSWMSSMKMKTGQTVPKPER